MNRDQCKQQLLEVMRTKLNLHHIERLEEKMHLQEELRIDSVTLIQLLVYIELEMGYEVPDEDIEPSTFKTVEGLIDFIATLERNDLHQVSVQSNTEDKQ
ncbi:phosphopantetheine-binding protein [Paenibacillus sp. ACRRX]|uniref:phosphopantetheine-binding protein n=1 Tax=unclassified Paenibacillus TaxID=185978 RepID=UPI001EF59242|nr:MULTISPECIES: phosphopantetheine-binding protein [unclassified Paenibacillus]MCG7407364.1 phosphopantetheine-binding protein [Paenibacillus sp. ACRRX]MDK8180590.1 phosphopantetheine-binding protein [Paenibacillus sp. UMB4589-SE434]